MSSRLHFEVEAVAVWKRVSVTLALTGYPALYFGLWRVIHGPVSDPLFGLHGWCAVLAAAGSSAGIAALAWCVLRPPAAPLVVVFDSEGVLLPRHRWARRTHRVRFEEVDSLNRILRGPWRVVAVGVEKGWGGAFAPSWFESGETADRIERELLARIGCLPDGDAKLRAIERRRAVGEANQVSPLWLTWGAMVLLVLVYVWELASGVLWTPFGGHRVGAISGWLLADGGWYRLATGQVLHYNLAHLLVNLMGLWLFGLLLESVLGGWRYVVLLLGSGLGGALATAAVPSPPAAGASTMVFGATGCLVYVNAFRRAELPVGLRALPWALAVLAACEILFEAFVPGLDWAAHLGGFGSGLLLSWPLLAGRELSQLRARQGPWLRVVASGLAVFYLAGLAKGAALLWTGDDSWHLRLGEHLLSATETVPVVLTLFARVTAADEGASARALDLARRAAERSVRLQSEKATHREALAAVHYRLGAFDAAIELQRQLLAQAVGEVDGYYASQLARSEWERLRRELGGRACQAEGAVRLRLEGENAPATRALVLELEFAHPGGVQVHALVVERSRLLGYLRATLGPGGGRKHRFEAACERLWSVPASARVCPVAIESNAHGVGAESLHARESECRYWPLTRSGAEPVAGLPVTTWREVRVGGIPAGGPKTRGG
jgi:rhomboid protease GluP